jgi:A/G-specific adenine glycosylase
VAKASKGKTLTARAESSAGRARGSASAPSVVAEAHDAEAAAKLTGWFGKNARELPWRLGPAGSRDPYVVLVSEAMLQQTQVSRVLERFPRFMARFPDVSALARADEHEVLAEWSGMGYYRRAKNLHGAARMVVSEFDGRVPSEAGELRKLPGVGRYTAGAIASIAHGRAAAIVDGNVARVLLRVHGRDAASDDPAVQAWLWERAGAIVAATTQPGAVNEALMELGATVCTPPPALPRCGQCPLRERCEARRQGRQGEIPRAKARAKQKNLYCGVAVVARADGSLLVEQRPGTGMWAGMWQAPTLEDGVAAIGAEAMAAAVGLPRRALRPESGFEHQTTHRRVLFQVWRAEVEPGFAARRGLWMRADKIANLALSNPQRRILLESAAGGTLWT